MLLKDDALIKTLESSKETGKEINEKIGESITMEKQIEVTRNMYTNVSKLGSTLFFVIKDLGLIDPMYQYSLQYIVRLFRNAMDQTEENSELEERL
jgi:dynein heavy chain